MANYNIGTDLTIGSYQTLAGANINTLSDNISNAGTAGFKGTEFSFQSALSNASMNVGNLQTFTQGAITANSNPMDVAINGTGFFATSTTTILGAGQTNYTRAGQFSLDTHGNLTTSTGQYVLGTDGKTINPPALAIANAPAAPAKTATNPNPVQPSYTSFTMGANGALNISYTDGTILTVPAPASQSAEVVNVTSLGSENLSAAQISAGTTYTGYTQGAAGMTLNFSDGTHQLIPPMSSLTAMPAAPAGGWTVATATAATTPPFVAGTSTPVQGPIADPSGYIDPTTGVVSQCLVLNFSVGGVASTAYLPAQQTAGAAGFSINNTTAPPTLTYTNANGSSISNISMDSKGLQISPNGSIIVSGVPSNPVAGSTGGAAGIALVNFANPNGLLQTQPGVWQWTPAASPTPPPLSTKPGDPGLGMLQSSSLESSNIDVTNAMVELLVAQRQYQATSQALKTQDQDLQAMIQLR